MDLLVSPEYHCELVGRGVESVCAIMKVYYGNRDLNEKNTKNEFEYVVIDTI